MPDTRSGRRPPAPRHGQEDQGRDGCPARGVHPGAIERGLGQARHAIFEQVAKFASYGFVKAHATAYALLAYQTAYLKANHPLEFFAAAMTMDRANQDRLTLYRQEIARYGIRLLPPDVNHGAAAFTVEDGPDGPALRYALAAIRGVGVQAVEALVAERQANGPFADLFDLSARIGGRVLNRRLLEALIRAGALDTLHDNRRCLLEGVEVALRYGNAHAAQVTSEQTSLFGGLLEHAQLPKPALPALEDIRCSIGCSRSSRRSASTCRRIRSMATAPASRSSGSCLGSAADLRRPAGQARRRRARQAGADDAALPLRLRPALRSGGTYEVTVFAELLGRRARPWSPAILF